MKVKLTITDKHIAIPLDLMGAPQMDRSWIARADLKIKDDKLVIEVYKRSFNFPTPTKIYEAESTAKAGFKKGEYEVKRVLKYSVFPHIPAKNFIKFNLPTGDFDFTLLYEKDSMVMTLDLSEFPKDRANIHAVKNMLVG